MLRIRHLASAGKYSGAVENRIWLVYDIYRRLDVLAQSIEQEGLTNQQLRSSWLQEWCARNSALVWPSQQ